MAGTIAGHGGAQEEDEQGQEPQPASSRLAPLGAAPQHLPAVLGGQAAPHRLRHLRLVPRPPGHRGGLSGLAGGDPPAAVPGAGEAGGSRTDPSRARARGVTDPLVVAVDAMGGDAAPAEVVAGARRAAAEVGIVLVGRPDALADTGDLEVVPAGQVIEMGEEPGAAVRRKKDASVVRAAEEVRDGRAAAMFSAGNTGAAMASALLRMGRIRGVSRPAVATPLPVPGTTPTLLLDAGANAECQAAWLVQFAQMGSAYARARYHLDAPRVGLLTIGEEDIKGTALVKEAHALLRETPGVRFVGNVEGRDLLSDAVDVVVTDGFTGNVALKAMEGALACITGAVQAVVPEEAWPPVARVLEDLDPEAYGGAMLLGVQGVCVIGHGSSSATAVANGIAVAAELVRSDLVQALRAAVTPAPVRPGRHREG
jgi:glycerol-3-phosphate acyltransferase PlsX